MAREPTPEGLWAAVWGTCVSLAFWMCLFVSAACFAAVALAPKYLQCLRLREQYAANQLRLADFERQVLQLQDVLEALKKDPAFAEELARVEFDAVRPGEEVLPVEPALRLDAHAEPLAGVRPAAKHPTWLPTIVVLANERDVRATLLLVSAFLVVVAFTWLHDRSEPTPNVRASRPRRKSLWQHLKDRYRRT